MSFYYAIETEFQCKQNIKQKGSKPVLKSITKCDHAPPHEDYFETGVVDGIVVPSGCCCGDGGGDGR